MKTTTKQPRLTTTEKRAQGLCDYLSRNDGGTITVEWIASRTWGSNPRVMHNGEKCTNISGCGYCKHSACLASALCYLGENEEQRRAIARTQGVGVSSVRDALTAIGWKMECVTSGKSYDVYTLSRATDEIPG